MTFLSGDFRLRGEPPRLSDGLRYLHLDPDPPLGLDHLGQIMDAVAPMLEARHNRIEEIFYYPADMASDRRGLDTLVSPIDLNDFLPADEAVGWDECAVSGDWVFHVQGVWLYPGGSVREPYGVCEGKLD